MNNTVSDISVKTMSGEEKKLEDYKGNVLLIVNVASYCGYTPQYNGLEQLHEHFKDQGLRVLGFPCNDFGAQEPGSNDEIMNFCSTKYGVQFEMFDKVHAKGPQQHPLYARLTSVANPPGDVAWNFEKFLISKDGEVVARFKSSVPPESEPVVEAIERELEK
jgi:glutathione peroxidase